jgi:hypothetical protein
LIGPSATGPLIDNLNTVAPGPARDILTGAIEDVANSRGAAGLAFVLGLLLALYSAAGYTGAFARASNAIYKVEEGRPIWTLKPARTTRCCLVVFGLAVPMKSRWGRATIHGAIPGGRTAVSGRHPRYALADCTRTALSGATGPRDW